MRPRLTTLLVGGVADASSARGDAWPKSFRFGNFGQGLAPSETR